MNMPKSRDIQAKIPLPQAILQVLKKSLTFFITVRIIINGKFVKKIFGIIGNGTSSWMVMNNTNL